MKQRIQGFLLGLVLMLTVAAGVQACTPAQVARAVPTVVEAACVLVHGFLMSGRADTICATAEDIAPFVPEMLAQREAEPPVSRPMVAFAIAELPEPKKARAPPKRRCASWVAVPSPDASYPPEASTEAGDR